MGSDYGGQSKRKTSKNAVSFLISSLFPSAIVKMDQRYHKVTQKEPAAARLSSFRGCMKNA